MLVLDADDKPAVNVTVTVKPEVSLPWAIRNLARTDALGILTESVPPGRYTVFALRDRERLDPQKIEVAPAQRVELTLRLPAK